MRISFCQRIVLKFFKKNEKIAQTFCQKNLNSINNFLKINNRKKNLLNKIIFVYFC